MAKIAEVVAEDIKALGSLSGIQPTLAAIALSLAERLDSLSSGNRVSGPDPTAAISKELRSTMEALEAARVDVDPFVASLSTPIHRN